MSILGQLRKRLRSLEKTSLRQIQLIPLIAALVLSLAIANFYPDPFRTSRGKHSRLVFNEEDGAFFTRESSFRVEKKSEEKTTQNSSVKPSIFDGLKTNRHVASHKSSKLMF